jgi:hypothetical protein
MGREPVREHVLDPMEVSPLFDALRDPSDQVRISAFGALTRLPLSPADWLRVARFVGHILDSGQSRSERLSVIRAFPWIPVRSVRERMNTLADEAERQALDAAVQALASDPQRERWLWPQGAADAPPLYPIWASSQGPPGFAMHTDSQVKDERRQLSRTALSDALTRLSLDDVARLVDAGFDGLAAASVTSLFEMEFADSRWRTAWGIGNHIVTAVEAVQGRFRPDPAGLFALYKRATTDFLGRWDVNAFLDEDLESNLRGTCWQLAWIVSRGGLRGLVPGLAGYLESEDREERVAAALLIADAADCVLHPNAPRFGGGFGLGRGPTRAVLVDDSCDRLPQGSTLDASLGGDLVECSAFAPPETSPASTFLVQAFAHIPEQARDEAARMATQFDPTTGWRAVKTLECKVLPETRLCFALTMPGLQVDDPEQGLVWNGKTASVQFGVSVPRDHGPGTVVGTLTVSKDWVPIGHIKFSVRIADAAVIRRKQSFSSVGEDARRYESAFISYASEDRRKVLERVQVLPSVGVRVVVDVIDLEPGERWKRELYRYIDKSDVVLLFWSTAAKRSKWVRREIRYALKRQQHDEVDEPPAIRPVIIEGPPVPRPWKEVEHLHFNDRMIFFMERSPKN